jgi:hypothetical protein
VPTERELRNSRMGLGKAVVDAIAVHGQDDFKRQERKPSTYKAKARPYCEQHHTYWCPCVRPDIYRPPFTRTNETAQAMKDWDSGTNTRTGRKRTG